MKPGRDLDELIAEKVMGWKRISYEQLYPSQVGRKEFSMYWYDSNNKETRLAEDCNDYYQPEEAWSPSTDIASAWQVIERIKSTAGDRVTFRLEYIDSVWSYGYENLNTDIFDCIEADTAPLAICLLALKALDNKSY